MQQYKGYFISGSAMRISGGCRSQGTVLALGHRGSFVEVKRIQGLTFRNKEDARRRGVELCRTWIDEYQSLGKKMDDLAREFAGTGDPHVKTQWENFSHQHALMRRDDPET
jgi:hypothetical protein